MPEEKENSNIDNNDDKNIVHPSGNTEEKSSSTGSQHSSNEMLDDSKTEKAVDDITHQDGDELLDIHTKSGPEKAAKSWQRFLKNKKFLIPAIVVLILIIVFAVPISRYKLLGLALKENYNLTLTDSQTGKPVTDAQVTLAGQKATTNSKGQAKLKVKVGNSTLSISKKYYKTLSEKVLVPLNQKKPSSFKLQATGRQVPLKVVNLINGNAVEGAKVTADGSTITTDNQGQATIVLPANDSSAQASISSSGYNDLSGTIKINGGTTSTSTFKMTPSGRVYFLSNLSGNIDVVSTNLDGTNRKTVLAGTGNEDPNDTVLLATRDWQYLALLSRRSGNYDSLYLINTANGQLTTIDTGAVNFNLVGWSGHNFVYEVTPSSTNYWQTTSKLKTFNADSGKLTTIAQGTVQGTQYDYTSEDIGFANLVGDDRVVYGLVWTDSGNNLSGKKDSIISVNADGTNKQDVRDISIPSNVDFGYMSTVLYDPQTLYIQLSLNAPTTSYYIYQYANNSVTQSNTLTTNSFTQAQQNYYTYLESPNGNQTFWSEPRDGKNTLFVGGYDGGSSKQIATLSDYTPYGWYGNNYLLVEKSGSELYIMPTTGGTAVKVSDYYKASQTYNGYGGGYGGL